MRTSPRPRRHTWCQDGYHPAMEVLEDRHLLTATFTYADPFGDAVIMREISESLQMSVPAVRSEANIDGVFDIQLQKSPALLANAAASAAFDAAAEFLESIFFDPITIIVDADFAPLGPGVIGSTGSSSVSVDLADLGALLIADAQEGETLPSQLPTVAQASVIVPPDDGNGEFTLAGGKANRATLKALGVAEADLPGQPSQFNPSVIRDMSMTFSSEFTFDFDPSDGIDPNLIDFVGVAIHEIGHGLGFVSSVDTVDNALAFPGQVSRAIEIGPLDFFRLRPGAGAVDFTTSPRVLTPEGDAVFYDGVYDPVGFNIPGLTLGDVPLSTGRNTGDGNQASHWKADDITGVTIGIMDPTAADGQLLVFSPQDARAFGLIGFDLIEPIPVVEVSLAGSVSKLEGDSGTQDFVFTVIATGVITVPFTVDFATSDVTATASVDYIAASGTLSFSVEGPTEQTITVTVFGDIVVESNEVFQLELSNATEPSVLGVSVAIGEILNDDVDVSISDATLVEGDSGTRNMAFTVFINGTLNTNASVSYSTVNGTADSATDYLPRVGVVSLSSQVTTGTITVPIVGDNANEATEQLFVALVASTGIRIDKGVGIGTITDDDALPSFYVNDVQVTSSSAGTSFANFTIALDSPSGREVFVDYTTFDGGAVNGVDFIGKSGTLSFAAGTTSKQVVIPIMTSATPSPDKSFFLNLSSAQNALMVDSQGKATIIFADTPQSDIIDNGEARYSTSGSGWTTLTNTLAYGLDYAYHAAGNGNAAATWSFTAIENGSYEVFARWTPFVNRATNAPYAILDGSTALGTTVGSVQVNQQAAPTGELADGVTWQSLGTYSISSNTLTVRLTNNANGFVVADAIRIVGDGIPPQVPEINISGGSQSVGSGDTTPSAGENTEFGTVNVGAESAAHVFTVTNTGNSGLALTGSPAVTISGAGAADFVVTSQPATAIQPGGSTTFQIAFHPTASGLRQAMVAIANNDGSENPYTFLVQGTGTADVTPFAHNFTLPQDVNSDSRVSAVDLWIVINNLISRSAEPAAAPLAATSADGPANYVDVNADGRLSSIDVWMVVNYLLDQQTAAPAAAPLAETSTDGDAALTAVAVHQAIALSEVSSDEALAAPLRVEPTPVADNSAADKSTSQASTALADAALSATFGDDDEESDEVVFAEADLALAFLDV